ncbi:glutamate racemase [bacterium]|nr:glutamate racemase [bacterium]
MKDENLPIGVFDSGVGGLTVVKEIYRKLPNEIIIYLGDTARYPYGPRSPEIIRKFATQLTNYLLKQKVKIIIIACNTASAVAVDSLNGGCGIPLIDVIKPGASAAVSSTKNGKIGIIGTTATVNSKAYENAIIKLNPQIQTYSRACPLFVPLAEEGWTTGNVVSLVAEEYLQVFKNTNIDTLILGCTHYPLLRGIIQETVGGEVKLIDSATATVDRLVEYLHRNGLQRSSNEPGRDFFYVTDAPQRFAEVGSSFLERRIEEVQKIELNS